MGADADGEADGIEGGRNESKERDVGGMLVLSVWKYWISNKGVVLSSVRFICSFVFVACEKLRIGENVLLFVYFWMLEGSELMIRVNILFEWTIIRIQEYIFDGICI